MKNTSHFVAFATLLALMALASPRALAAAPTPGREHVLSGGFSLSSTSQKTTFTEFSGSTTTRIEEESPRSYSAALSLAYRRNFGVFEVGPSASVGFSSTAVSIGGGLEGDYNWVPNRPGQAWVPGTRLSLQFARADTKGDQAGAAIRWSGAARVFLKAFPASGPLFLESSLGLVYSTSSSDYTIPGVLGQATVNSLQWVLASAIGTTF